MYQYVTEVEQYPLTGFPAFHSQHLLPMPPGRLDHLVDQCLDVTIRCAAGYDHEVRNVGQGAHIQGNDVPPLAVFQRVDDTVAQTLGRLPFPGR